jgi:hypothetical protein
LLLQPQLLVTYIRIRDSQGRFKSKIAVQLFRCQSEVPIVLHFPYDSSGGTPARNLCSAFLADEEERKSNLAGGRVSVHQLS